ncbi:Aspirochlorine biosynthesis protein N-like protein 3 [Elsinoe fawcettii]|nr:Aspirochlorine biosynthesis protein N-like protein 3 [Elsinoe fawcettii]
MPHNVEVWNIRECMNDFSVEKNGFQIMKVPSPMPAADFNDEDKIRATYLPQIGTLLRQALGAKRVLVHDFLVRKSEASFPISSGEPFLFEQPATALHVDSTPADTARIARQSSTVAPDLPVGRIEYVTVWRPLRGPVKRWPMLVCDVQTVDGANDLKAKDMVYPNEVVVESMNAHFSDKYKFFYLREQESSEALVMMQADSTGRTGVPHSAFNNPDTVKDDPQRESIEVRCLVFY